MMAADIDTLSPLIVAHSSLRKLLKDTKTQLQEVPSSRTFAPSAERELLTFIAAVCPLRCPDCEEAAVAVSRGAPPSTDTTIYVATVSDVSVALQNDLRRFVDDLRAAYSPSPDIVGNFTNQVFTAMYRFAYPALRECLWNDERFQEVSIYLGKKKAASRSILQALKKLKTITTESDSAAITWDVFQDMHESCSIIHTFVCDKARPGTVVSDFLADVASVCTVACYFDPIFSGACLADKDVASLIKDTRGGRWEIVWIPGPPPPSAPFEVEVSASDVAAWLDEYSRCSSILPWESTAMDIASACPEPLTKTGSLYTCDKRPAFHSEIILLLWLFRHDIAVDKHIGCSGVVCYPCSKLAQALGKVHPEYDVALSDMFDSTTIELPWALPPDVPKVVVGELREIILEDFRSDIVTYISRDGLYQNAFGPEVPEFPE